MPTPNFGSTPLRRFTPRVRVAGVGHRPDSTAILMGFAMAAIHITDVESAINWWRERLPSPDGITACAEVRALAEIYALMVYYHEDEWDEAAFTPAAREAWLGWYATTPDAPCIAVCSTSQGDGVCKGCGRTFDEVQRWPEMTPVEKRQTWRRITMAGSAWRFNRYAERSLEAAAKAGA